MASPTCEQGRQNAEQIIALADALREQARATGRDLNAANLFVHTVLARAIKYDDAPAAPPAVRGKPSAARYSSIT